MKTTDPKSIDFNSIEVFKKKSLADVFKEIYDNQHSKDEQVNQLIEALKPLITDISGAIQLAPLLKDYLDISIKNNEQLVKLVAVIQRAIAVNKSESTIDDEMIIPKEEKEQLIKNASILKENDKQISSMIKSVEELTKEQNIKK